MSVKEKFLLFLSIGSFIGYLVFRLVGEKLNLHPVMSELFSLLLLLGILQHYFYTLAHIVKMNSAVPHKALAFMFVLVIGHFGSWTYYLFFNLRLAGKVPETDKIELRPFVLDADSDQEQQKLG
ncbi:hypothetical protein ACFL5V_00280 [Fibrobacterota bacterium]